VDRASDIGDATTFMPRSLKSFTNGAPTLP